MTQVLEVNLDGIVGPTHNYAGLSYGNVASMANKRAVSNPRQAALQGLAKMKLLADLGVQQAVLPPHERPHIPTLRRLGFEGSDGEVVETAANFDPVLLAAVSSASAMWSANAATVSPSTDTRDRRVHFTPANLISNFHRSIEAPTTARILRAIFADERHFVHHDPLPATAFFSDEGAANHTRLGTTELFTYGWSAQHEAIRPAKFPARQSMGASHTIAWMHRLKQSVFVLQHPDAVDAGAFHNDVVAVGHRNLLLYHERGWMHADQCVERLRALVPELIAVEVKEKEVPLAEAISSYLFNSQLVTLPDDTIALIGPTESRHEPHSAQLIHDLLVRRIISAAHFVDVRDSMRNGGGPACLRLRVALTQRELNAMHQGVLFTGALHEKLTKWVNRHYRDHLTAADLADRKLLDESRRALDELTGILRLPAIYEFQREIRDRRIAE